MIICLRKIKKDTNNDKEAVALVEISTFRKLVDKIKGKIIKLLKKIGGKNDN